MRRRHALPIALLLGAAAAAVLVAVGRTVALGASATPAAVPQARIAEREPALDRYEAQPKRELEGQPPKLPAVPERVSSETRAAAPPPVVYVRPKPVIVTTHRSGGDDDYDREDHDDSQQQGGDDGAGWDD